MSKPTPNFKSKRASEEQMKKSCCKLTKYHLKIENEVFYSIEMQISTKG